MSSEFVSPASGSQWKPANSLDHLLIIEVHELNPKVSTSFGEAEALRCTVHDITEGETYGDVLVFTNSLIVALKPRIGQKVLAVLDHGKAKPGQNPPYLLVDKTDDKASVSSALAFLEASRAPKVKTRDPEIEAALAALRKEGVMTPKTEQIPF